MLDISKLPQALRLPIIMSPMLTISYLDMVIAACKAGIIGSFPALNARPQEQLYDWLREINSALHKHEDRTGRAAAPYAVNQIVHRSNSRLFDDLAVCAKFKVPLIITSLGAREDVNDFVHEYGGIVFHDVINQEYAHKAIEKGADGLILVAAGAGGHAGRQSPFALLQETRAWFDGPIVLGGAISTAEAILAAQILGADFVYMGSRFIPTIESNASIDYKEAIIHASADNIVYTNSITGIWANFIDESLIKAGLDINKLPEAPARTLTVHAKEGSLRSKAWRDIWGCGQGIGLVEEIQSISDIVDDLHHRYMMVRKNFVDLI